MDCSGESINTNCIVFGLFVLNIYYSQLYTNGNKQQAVPIQALS